MSEPAVEPVRLSLEDLTLESCEAKYRRGRGYAIAMREEVRTFFEDHPYEVVPERDVNGLEYVFHVWGLHPPDPDWSLLAGDCMFNLRGVLDHLVLQLSRLGQGRELTLEEESGCMFPITIGGKKFNRNRIDLLRLGEQTRITQLQPPNAWDSSIWGAHNVPAALASTLERLEVLHNIDKHRRVHPSWLAMTGYPALPQGFISGSASGQRLEDGAEIGRWTADKRLPKFPEGVDVKPYFPLGVSLDEPLFANDIVDLLTHFTNAVQMVIDVFTPCITQGGPALPLAGLAYWNPPPGVLGQPL